MSKNLFIPIIFRSTLRFKIAVDRHIFLNETSNFRTTNEESKHITSHMALINIIGKKFEFLTYLLLEALVHSKYDYNK